MYIIHFNITLYPTSGITLCTERRVRWHMSSSVVCTQLLKQLNNSDWVSKLLESTCLTSLRFVCLTVCSFVKHLEHACLVVVRMFISQHISKCPVHYRTYLLGNVACFYFSIRTGTMSK